MKTKSLIIIGIVIIVGVIVVLNMTVFPNDSSKIIDPSSLEYLRALQELCKQNENSDSVTMIDGPRWQNSTHYFDVPDCEFRKL